MLAISKAMPYCCSMKKQSSFSDSSLEALSRAAQIVGSKSALAKRVGVTPQAAAQWFSQVRPIPPRRCRLIEEATGGVVTRYDLRPDVFGSQPDMRGSGLLAIGLIVALAGI